MAITDKNATAQDAVTTKTATAAKATAAPAAPAAQPKTWSFHGGNLFGSPIGRTMGSEYLDKLMKALAERFASANGMEVTLIPIDRNNEPTLAFSVIVVCVRFKEEQAGSVAYHTLVIEATGERPKAIYETIQNRPIEIKRFSGDAMDQVLAGIVKDRVQAAFPRVKIFPVDGCVVPSDLFDVTNPAHIHQLAVNAATAAGTEIEVNTPGFRDLSVAEAAKDSNLTFNLAIARTQIPDAVQYPQRSDVIVSFTSQQRGANQQNQSLNSGNRDVTVSEMTGYVEPIWAPVAGQQNLNPFVLQQNQPTQKFAARLVITSAASQFSLTPAAMLLSLTPAISLRDESNWIQAYKPAAVGSNDIDLHDIGALNYEGRMPNAIDANTGYGLMIDTKADDFKLQDLGQLVSILFQPGLMISIDVPRCGPQTWYTSWLSGAAGGNTGVQEMIIAAADNLTNGHFSARFQKGTPIFVDVAQVHLGYYTDKNGQHRDLRDFDYLAIANLFGANQPHVIAEWSDTFFNHNKSIFERLATRAKMINAASGESAVFTGMADRLTFSNAFIDAYVLALKDAGLMVRINTPLTGSDFNNTRGVASFAAGALLAPGQNFTQASTAWAPQYANSGVGFSRFSM